MRLFVETGIVLFLCAMTYLMSEGGVEKAGYQLGAFAHQVSAGFHGDKFEAKAQ